MLDSPKRELVLDAFRAGARGIFSKHEPLETLRKCVRVVFEGQIWATSREIRYALDALSSAPTIHAINAGGLSLLSRREQQVVHYLAEGLTNREIGAQLGLSRHTIKNYLLKIFDKLGVSNRVELLFLTLSQPSPVAQFSQVAEDAKKK
jgi:DNA-binding NarL/FixJ family response regulator